jgi:excisionase family DNA binding protein
MIKEPLTTGEVAELCHVTYRSVLMWIEEEKLNSYKTPGGHNRIKKDDFLDFLKRYNMPIPEELKTGVAKKKILIADDDKDMVKTIKAVLQMKNGYEIDTAYDGFDTGTKLLVFRPDLLILDVRMPGVDGYEIIKRIKQSPEASEIKIIAISGYFKEEGRKRILSLGVDACLNKPFEPEKLLEKIKELI